MTDDFLKMACEFYETGGILWITLWKVGISKKVLYMSVIF